jgi:hypothetical protein
MITSFIMQECVDESLRAMAVAIGAEANDAMRIEVSAQSRDHGMAPISHRTIALWNEET